MNCKWVIFAFSVVFSVLAAGSDSMAVETREVDICCQKELLDDRDLRIIDNFVADAVDELVETKDFTSVARIRTIILSRSNSNVDSAKAQYAAQFSESAHKYISAALEEAKRLNSAERRFKIVLNLLILVDSLEDLHLADLAMDWLDSENKAIQYWAVHSVTNDGVIEQLNSRESDNSELAENITERLEGLVAAATPEVLGLMAEFAAGVQTPRSEGLLMQIADTRIKRYENWTVEYELLDGSILKLLDDNISSGNMNPIAVARRFAQLYSYAIQRYVKGQYILSDTQKQQLASVLVETEIFCISKLLGMAQSVVKSAVEQDDYTALIQEHDRLLGSKTQPGQLPLKLDFDYGQKPNGDRRTAPLVLPEPTEN